MIPSTPSDIPEGATVELLCADGGTEGVVLRNYRDEGWLQLHDGVAIDDVEYEEIVEVVKCIPPAIVKQPDLTHRPLAIADQTSFEANQGRGWGK